MKFRITTKINDGLNEVPPLEVEVKSVIELMDQLYDELINDLEEPFGVGMTLLVERTE